jgi:hypothetical protein
VCSPSAFKAVDEPLLDGEADVAVDPAHAGQPVPESLGLGGLGDAVLDQPRLVRVP